MLNQLVYVSFSKPSYVEKISDLDRLEPKRFSSIGSVDDHDHFPRKYDKFDGNCVHGLPITDKSTRTKMGGGGVFNYWLFD